MFFKTLARSLGRNTAQRFRSTQPAVWGRQSHAAATVLRTSRPQQSSSTSFSNFMFRSFSTKDDDYYDLSDDMADLFAENSKDPLLESAQEFEATLDETEIEESESEDEEESEDEDESEYMTGEENQEEEEDEFDDGIDLLEAERKKGRRHPNAVLIDPVTGNRRDPRHGPPITKDIDHLGRAYGVGGRKNAKAEVWIQKGTGECFVNQRNMVDYFPAFSHRINFVTPFEVTGTLGEFDVYAYAKSGGITGQAEAVRHGIARALNKYDPEYRPALKKAGFLTRDSRIVERKHIGKKKARKAPQWVKR